MQSLRLAVHKTATRDEVQGDEVQHRQSTVTATNARYTEPRLTNSVRIVLEC